MFPEYPDFRPIELADCEEYESVVGASRSDICELAFANLYIWQDFDRPKFTRINGSLCIMIEPLNESPFFMEPIGGDRIEDTVRACIEHAGRISRATADFIAKLDHDLCSFHELRDHSDYIYSTAELAKLKGRRFDGKRNHINAFKKLHPDYEFVTLSEGDGREALELFDSWCRHREGSGVAGENLPPLVHGCQRRALGLAIEAYDALGLIGCGIRVEGRLAGFLLGARQNADTVCVPLAYCRRGIQGVAPALLWEACRGPFSKFEYVNLEQDLGIEGLRRSKKSYYPLRLVEKYDVVRKGRAS